MSAHAPISEEPLDYFLHRPPARLVAALLHPTGLSANQLTIVGCAVGIAGGAAIGFGTQLSAIIAASLLWLFLILDCADGELARRRGGGTRLGQILDGISDYFVAISVHVGLLVLVLRAPAFAAAPWWLIVAVVAASGVCKAVHSAQFDAAKAKFRRSLGKGGGGLEPEETLRAELASAATFRERLILRIYILYLKMQRGVIAPSANERPPSPAEFLGWSMLGPTMRMTVVIASLVAFLFDPRALAVYPAVAIVGMNLWLAAMAAWRRVNARTR